jgi:hypothetical protein
MTVNRNRALVKTRAAHLDIAGTTLEDAFKIIVDLINKYGRDARIDYIDYGDPYEASCDLEVTIERPETDAEMAARIEREEAGEDIERQLYEELKKRFEGDGK